MDGTGRTDKKENPMFVALADRETVRYVSYVSIRPNRRSILESLDYFHARCDDEREMEDFYQ